MQNENEVEGMMVLQEMVVKVHSAHNNNNNN